MWSLGVSDPNAIYKAGFQEEGDDDQDAKDRATMEADWKFNLYRELDRRDREDG